MSAISTHPLKPVKRSSKANFFPGLRPNRPAALKTGKGFPEYALSAV